MSHDLGPKEMLKQSLTYLTMHYVESGLSAEEAKARTAEDVKDLYRQLTSDDTLLSTKRNPLFKPREKVEELMAEVRTLKSVRVAQRDEQARFDYSVSNVIRGLNYLKNQFK